MKHRSMQQALIFAGLIGTNLALCGLAQAVPFVYSATYTITELSVVPSEWGPVQVGDSLTARLVWNADAAVPVPGLETTYDPGVLVDYRVYLGYGTVRPISPLWSVRAENSADITAFDNVPVTSVGSALIFDEAIFGFSCANWANRQNLPTTLACGNGLQGSLYLTPLPTGQTFILRASLTDIRFVPEPDTLALLGLGLLGLGVSRRRKCEWTA